MKYKVRVKSKDTGQWHDDEFLSSIEEADSRCLWWNNLGREAYWSEVPSVSLRYRFEIAESDVPAFEKQVQYLAKKFNATEVKLT